MEKINPNLIFSFYQIFAEFCSEVPSEAFFGGNIFT